VTRDLEARGRRRLYDFSRLVGTGDATAAGKWLTLLFALPSRAHRCASSREFGKATQTPTLLFVSPRCQYTAQMHYTAFMSYSHAADGKLAPALQSALQRFAKRWYQLRACRVFRDKTSLSVSPALWPSIESALGKSKYFLLLASPEAARSAWVEREVDWWLKNRPIDQLLILVTDGELVWNGTRDFDWDQTTALPRNLRGQFAHEPLYVDLRWAKTENNLSLMHSQFRGAVLDIAATLHGQPKDDLDGEDVRQFRKGRSIALAGVAAVMVFAVVAVWQAYMATHERDTAERQLRLTIAGELASNALNSLNADPERSILLALEAASASYLANGALTSEAEDALHRALEASRVRLVLSDHQGTLSSAAYSPDGRRVATSDSLRVQVWDAVSGRPLGPARAGKALGMAFSPDGTYLATAGLDSVARLWEVASGREVRSFSGLTAPLWSVAFSPDGKRLAIASKDGTASVWDVASGQRLNTLRGHNAPVSAIAFSPDGKRLASGSQDATARVWDSSSGRELLRISSGDSPVRDVAFSPDGKRLAMASFDTDVKIWDSVSGSELLSLKGNTASVLGVAFSPDGTRVAAAGHDKSVRVWDAASGKAKLTLVGHTDGVVRVAFGPDGDRLLSASLDSTARLWDLTSSSELPTLSGHTGEVRGVAFSPDGNLVASASADATARIWDVDTGKELRAMVGHQAAINGVAFSPNGKWLATASSDRSTRVWDVATGRELLALVGHQGEVFGVAFSRDGGRLATASSDRTARLWDAATGRALSSFVGHVGKVTSIDFNPDGSRLVTSAFEDESQDGWATTKIWDVASGRKLLDLPGDYVWVSRAVFSRDGKHLATGGVTSPFQLKMWNADSGEELLTLSGHTAAILSVALSPDGKRAASSGSYGAVKIWDVDNGRELFSLSGHITDVNAIAFSPNGKRLATGSGWTVRTYVVDPDDLIALAESRITRPPTLEECKRYLRTQDCSQTVSSLVWEGKELLRSGELAAATVKFRLALDRSKTPNAGLKAQTTTAALLLIEGRARAGLADIEGATATFEQARRFEPDLGFEPGQEVRRIAAISQVSVGKRLMSLNRNLEAIEPLESAVALDALNDRAYLALGRAYRNIEAYDKAIVIFRKAAEIHRTALTYAELGETYRLKHDYAQAREQLKMAISLDPNDEWSRRVLGITLRETGEYTEAKAQLAEAIRIRPTKWGYVELARTYRLQSDYVHALENVSKAKSIDPNYATAYQLAASIQHDDLLNFEAAYQEYRKVLEAHPGDEGDKADLAEAALTSGRFKEARLFASELILVPASTKELSEGDQLAIRFVAVASLLLDGEPATGRQKLKELYDYYKTLPIGFDQSWSYKGTRNFVMRHPMNQATRTTLIGVLDMIEKGRTGPRTAATDAR
jgi:WD40 repeat protein/tetratricopeptide (TPR) repeat protein